MLIQVNTDHHIDGHQSLVHEAVAKLEKSMTRYASQITRIEVHLHDENGERHGRRDKRCMLEARLAGEDPLAVTNTADTVHGAVMGARDKLVRVLEKHVSRHRPPKGLDSFEKLVERLGTVPGDGHQS
jgi:ribosome-associated translation inhibitor RaiA